MRRFILESKFVLRVGRDCLYLKKILVQQANRLESFASRELRSLSPTYSGAYRLYLLCHHHDCDIALQDRGHRYPTERIKEARRNARILVSQNLVSQQAVFQTVESQDAVTTIVVITPKKAKYLRSSTKARMQTTLVSVRLYLVD
jgi:hypothetical protein